jgi:hypothetical protein
MRRIIYVSLRKNRADKMRILWLSVDLKAIQENQSRNKNLEENSEEDIGSDI